MAGTTDIQRVPYGVHVKNERDRLRLLPKNAVLRNKKHEKYTRSFFKNFKYLLSELL